MTIGGSKDDFAVIEFKSVGTFLGTFKIIDLIIAALDENPLSLICKEYLQLSYIWMSIQRLSNELSRYLSEFQSLHVSKMKRNKSRDRMF